MTTTEAPHSDGFATLSPDLIIEAVEAQEQVCDGRLLALNSYENRVYRVGIEGKAPLIAKFYRPGRWSPEQIREEHEFALELSSSEIPVVAPLPAQDGNTLRHHDGFDFALYPMHGGRSPELDSAAQLQLVGRFIGRFHNVAETRHFSSRQVLDCETLGTQSVQYLIDNKRLPTELAQAYESICRELLGQIQEIFSRHQDTATLRLHGDFHPGNVLMRDDTIHIVDLDDTRTGPAIQDVWMFLSGDRQYQQARLTDLLDGYSMFRDFNPTELGLIEALRTLRIIHYASWLDQRREEPAFQQAFPWLASNRYWDDHILALKEQRSALDEPSLQWD